ncbi:hypothetical protein LOZ53_001491 [Ophidiomyces ophidiicola]|uniref:Uncharacterized protein n=1 Tax=Ophidiomyces ophidiicola TaxID=1387563 RepID=A0ACB8UT63_9EURO|nr:uncharacterized protein LOZ57_001318 [Ophidiomyces ophidiicola]KAI1907638.1 hypothetical protein LOZ64_005810 [Ophidiomyces ophidiicola]KAI1909839.1 hypothetical protein LOZ61_004765 [Ophidiomyces ophidiicola]KAI1917246.1 hypothetical protein LOZ65_005137 [Ophidiomyces ophidiicola]KAI1925007.1 hypothetical protein LOZ60_004369 [Ophidiomyces ophidiicola]KAI1937732.1 hypothetical protein LOZ66_004013 [Ophidiomyces ophidiicola]
MAGTQYGAIGLTFKIVRILQAVCLIAIIGMTSNFISQMVSNNTNPPEVLVGTLSVTCIAVLYCVVTFILFLDDILPFLISTGLDGLHLIAVVVVAVTVGKPLSYVNCNILGRVASSMSSAYTFTAALGNSLAKNGDKISYTHWIGTSKQSCLEMKSIWGLSIALCILFALSATCSIVMWRQKKPVPPKDVEG